MSGEGCGEPKRLAVKEGARGGTMGSPAQETGGSPRFHEEGGTRGKHGVPRDREPKASGAQTKSLRLYVYRAARSPPATHAKR